MLQRLKRKRGGQPGNQNALGNRGPVTHGHYTRAAREARWAKWEKLQAEYQEQRKRFEEWSAPRLEACRAQHARIMAEIEAERAERAKTEPDLWGPID